MLILGLILFGMLIGAGAQLVLGRQHGSIDWGLAMAAGLIGSFVGGLLSSLVAGDGLALRPSGIIGSLVGAVLVTGVWRWYAARSRV
ncbi:MAG: GlsB/YeaQ/YmgE family stress response membrane protein [Ornithinimicrobium sp.]